MSQTDRYPRIRRFLAEHPWAIVPQYLDLIVEIVGRRVYGDDLSPEEKALRVEAARRSPEVSKSGAGVAVVPVRGIISHRASLVDDVSPRAGTSTEQIGAQLRVAMKDPDVGSIVLDVDSPGGSIFGVPELADEIYELKGKGAKIIVAVTNAMAGSAAYWLASQADELVVTPSGEVGSVGVYALHEDWSRHLEEHGLKITYISAGRYKVEGAPELPLTEEAREHFQSIVDGHYETFVKAVARGRRTTPARVKKDFGEGRMVPAHRAVELGMADSVGTLRDTIARLVSGGRSKSRGRASAEHARARFALAKAGR